MKIYTDASRLNNGSIGIGIIFVNDDKITNEFSYKFPLKGNITLGEISAVLYALSMIDFKLDKLELYTDSMNVINYVDGVFQNIGKDYTNLVKLLNEELDRVNSLTTYGVRILKVKAHSGDKFNNKVDELAKKAL